MTPYFLIEGKKGIIQACDINFASIGVTFNSDEPYGTKRKYEHIQNNYSIHGDVLVFSSSREYSKEKIKKLNNYVRRNNNKILSLIKNINKQKQRV